ncbi:MAG: caspase family protein [Fimbriimonas sp.]
MRLHWKLLVAVFGVSLLMTGAVSQVPKKGDDDKRIRVDRGPQDPTKRYALVIGNATYTSQKPLRNTENDARDMKKLLTQLGFDVTLKLNVNKREFADVVEAYTRKLAGGGFGLFFYSGHGAQYEGENYLIPTDCEINRPADLKFDAYAVGKLTAALDAAKNNSNVIILDACRNNPFAGETRGNDSGLAQVNAPSGTLIAFATGPGRTASDNSNGNNGLYTGELMKFLKVPGLSITEAFIKTRVEVKKASNGQQIPWESSSLESNIALVAAPEPPKVTPSKTSPTPEPAATATSYVQEGRRFRNDGRLPDAENSLRKAIKLEPENIAALNLLGMVMVDQKRFADAITTFEKAIALSPNNAVLQNNAGECLRNLKRYDEAKAKLQKAIDLDPKYAAPLNSMGLILTVQGKTEEALPWLLKACEAGPNVPEHFLYAGLSLRSAKRVDEAISYTQKALDLDPRFDLAMNTMGLIQEDRMKYGESETWYRKAMATNPTDPLYPANVAGVLVRLNRRDDALPLARRSRELGRIDHWVFKELGIQ